jgi:Cu/Ag efflux protein CusF
MKRTLVILTVCLVAATAAHAQMGGGGGGGRRGRGGQQQKQPDPSPPSTSSAPTPAPQPAAKTQIVGVIKDIDPATNRVTITYEPVEALNWPAGTMPFIAANSTVLKGATVGEKVRFGLDSQQISSLEPF